MNCSAVWCRFSAAAEVTSRALFYEPNNLKALYRSGQAYKEQGMYDRALEGVDLSHSRDGPSEGPLRDPDFKAILRQDPSNATAQAALSETIQLNHGQAFDRPEQQTYESGNALWDTETTSDSSEYEHEGNGTPCRYLNHGGCRHGAHCRWKHAPDERSVRDQL